MELLDLVETSIYLFTAYQAYRLIKVLPTIDYSSFYQALINSAKDKEYKYNKYEREADEYRITCNIRTPSQPKPYISSQANSYLSYPYK